MRARTAAIGISMLVAGVQPALCWGDDGHKTVALIAQQCLTKAVKQKVTAMLAADTDSRTPHDIASEATWADKWRPSHPATANWHFVDMEIDKPDLNAACFGRKPLPAGTLASNGPADACVVDKIEQFKTELAAPNTDSEERLFALKFLLHFVGDLHQPLHSSDHNDRGGNDVKIIVEGFNHTARDELHGFWDTQFVDALDTRAAQSPTGSRKRTAKKKASPNAIAAKLLAQITPADAKTWAAGTPEDWQDEAFKISQADAYRNPPLSKDTLQHLDAAYAAQAEKDIALQLSRAGVRLAFVLNQALGTDPSDWDACLKGH